MRRIAKLPNGKFVEWSTVTDSFFDSQFTFVEMVNKLAEFERFNDSAIEFLMDPANRENFEQQAAWMWYMNGMDKPEMYSWLSTRGCDANKIAEIERLKKNIDKAEYTENAVSSENTIKASVDED